MIAPGGCGATKRQSCAASICCCPPHTCLRAKGVSA
ncbi:Hypothetical Protein XCAW_03994 [Xanthomonas citri subsp. citri Aw12879]|nr:Hypothetical Protein XCAW_03994 [Xanthomonas citri subsp. citri Aw12879]